MTITTLIITNTIAFLALIKLITLNRTTRAKLERTEFDLSNQRQTAHLYETHPVTQEWVSNLQPCATLHDVKRGGLVTLAPIHAASQNLTAIAHRDLQVNERVLITVS